MGRLLREASPAFKPRGCVGFDVIVAIETQRCVAVSGVHEGAVMRRGRIGMDIGPEMRAGDAHALTGIVPRVWSAPIILVSPLRKAARSPSSSISTAPNKASGQTATSLASRLPESVG